MTDQRAHIHITAGAASRLDALCPTCLKPSMWRVPLYWLRGCSVGAIGHRDMCDDCDIEGGDDD